MALIENFSEIDEAYASGLEINPNKELVDARLLVEAFVEESGSEQACGGSDKLLIHAPNFQFQEAELTEIMADQHKFLAGLEEQDPKEQGMQASDKELERSGQLFADSTRV